jgi:UDP-N-acetylglucosamine 1-carboxyvinyltransferase
MDEFEIRGGVRLRGSVRISGSKNAALPCLFATILTNEPCVLSNVPLLDDIRTTLRLLTTVGKKVGPEGHIVHVKSGKSLSAEAPYDLVRRMRASVLVMGPLLARKGRAKVSFPGGCAIGARPINFHIEGFKKLGARIRLSGGYVEATARRLLGARVKLPFPSVGATENLMMAAVLAKGTTVIETAAREPEIEDLGRCLQGMGARIAGLGTSKIVIQGVNHLSGIHHKVIPDRIEAGTFLIAAAITRGRVTLKEAHPAHLKSLLEALRRAGVKISITGTTLMAEAGGLLRAVSIRTGGYPDFPTDMQAQWSALMSTVPGTSAVTETIFENRAMHVQELERLGARVRQKGRTTLIEGGKVLSGGPVMVSDLRAGAALVLAGLAAQGTTKVLRIYHLDRGYERLENKLTRLGARIRRNHR